MKMKGQIELLQQSGMQHLHYTMVFQAKELIERLKNEVPKQEVGRLSYKELTLSRANKSVRVFNHVVVILMGTCNQMLL